MELCFLGQPVHILTGRYGKQKKNNKKVRITNFLIAFLILSDKKNGALALICELMDMNLYEMIRGNEC